MAEKMPAPTAMSLLMGAETRPVEELAASGFVDRIFEDDPVRAGQAFLAPLICHESEVLQGYKTIWFNKWEESKLQARIEKEVENCAALWESEAHHRQVARFLNKRC